MAVNRTGINTRVKVTRAVATKPAASKPAKNGVAEDKAAHQTVQIMKEIIEKIVAARGADDIGENDQWSDQRRAEVDDYVYDLAVEVRKLREIGSAWWRIAYELQLPHNGPSAKQGKGGAAYARRLWVRAWGALPEAGERSNRETKSSKRERAITTEARPYFTEEAKDMDVIKAVCGKEIHWTARVGNGVGAVVSPQTAFVHHDPRTIRIVLGPRGRVLEFFEALDAAHMKVDPRMAIAKTGPRRSVYLSRIEKVGQ